MPRPILTSMECVFIHHSNIHRRDKEKYNRQEFVAIYGVSVQVCTKIWLAMKSNEQNISENDKLRPYHLLWGLYFLKQYGVSEVMANYFGCADKTFRKWVWIVIDALEELYEQNVSTFYFALFRIIYNSPSLFSPRFCFQKGFLMTTEVIASCLSMGQTSRFKNPPSSCQSGIPTSFGDQDYATRSD